MRKMWVVLVLIAAVILGSLYIMQTHIVDSRANRRRVAQRLQRLDSQFRVNPQRNDLLDEIEKAANSTYSFERTYALSVLGKLGRQAKPTVPTIERCLSSADPYVRDAAAHALANIGQDASSATNALIRTLRSYTNESAAAYAAEALGEIGNPSPEVLAALELGATKPESLAVDACKEAYKKLTGEDLP